MLIVYFGDSIFNVQLVVIREAIDQTMFYLLLLLELFVLGDIDSQGRCQIVQNLGDTSHAPDWLTQDVIGASVIKANEQLANK